MADPRFFKVGGPFTLAQLADISGAQFQPKTAAGRLFRDVAPLDSATGDDVSFLVNPGYLDAFAVSMAGAIVVHPKWADRAPADAALLLAENPYKAYAVLAQAFYPPAVAARSNIAKSAAIDSTAVLGANCIVEDGAAIGAGARIGDRCRIGANAVVGPGVVLGDDVIVGACASISHAVIGARVYIYTGARIGQDGFGFASDADGHTRVPQLGRVIIHDDVEIGANTTIDRGAGPDTVIGAGCMIDNLVQIGHNVQMGRGCVIVAQVGIAGSTVLEDFVVIGGQTGVAGHLRIGAAARIAGQSGVRKDIAPGDEMAGSPAIPIVQWRHQTVALMRMFRRGSNRK